MTTYTVTAERSGKWWVLQAVEAPGAISQVSRLEQADQIREAIAFVTGEPEDTIEIRLQPMLPSDIETALQEAREIQEEADRTAAYAAMLRRQVARDLQAHAGLPLRDVGTVLNVSFQRAHQLASEATEYAWQRLSHESRNWLVHHRREPVSARVWDDLQDARFVFWWGEVREDGTHVLEPEAWDFIESRADYRSSAL